MTMINPSLLLTSEEIVKLKKPKDWFNYFTVFSIWFQIAFSVFLYTLYPYWYVFVIAALLIGTRQFALVILMHDGAHNLINRNSLINDFISQWLCAFPMMTDTYAYRVYHLQHHKHTESSKDPDKSLTDPFPATKWSFFRKITRDVTGIAGLRRYLGYFISAWGKDEKTFFGHLKHFIKKLKGFFISQIIIFSFFLLADIPLLYFLLWWVPKLTVFSLFYRLRNIAEHACTSGNSDFSNTRTTLSPWIVRFFIAPLNVNFHLEHHLFMFCPWYNLPLAHSILKTKSFYKDLEIDKGYLNVFSKVLVN